MARNMDKYRGELKLLQELAEQAAEAGRHYRALTAQKDLLEKQLILKMQGSIVGCLDGEPAFEIVATSRDSVRKADVLLYAPEKAHLIIKTKETEHIHFIPKVK